MDEVLGLPGSDEQFADATALVDAWFNAWVVDDPEALPRLAASDVVFRDRYSALNGLDEVSAHVAAARRFMPGIKLERTGPVRHCQGVVLADWAATKPDGATVLSGTNVFVLGPDKKFTSVTGVPK